MKHNNRVGATIIEIVDHPLYNEFVIKFDDGYTDSFQMTEEGNVIPGNWESGKDYAAAVTDDMQMLGLLSADEFVWNFRHDFDGDWLNVWIRRHDFDDGTTYDVYYKGDYYFHVKQQERQWIAETARKIDPQPIDEKIAKKVINLLETEHLLIPFKIV